MEECELIFFPDGAGICPLSKEEIKIVKEKAKKVSCKIRTSQIFYKLGAELLIGHLV
jgi:hypothetical protein